MLLKFLGDENNIVSNRYVIAIERRFFLVVKNTFKYFQEMGHNY